jgi:hypothetical protein
MRQLEDLSLNVPMDKWQKEKKEAIQNIFILNL